MGDLLFLISAENNYHKEGCGAGLFSVGPEAQLERQWVQNGTTRVPFEHHKLLICCEIAPGGHELSILGIIQKPPGSG